MSDALIQLALFSAKALVILILVVAILIVFFALLSKGKEKHKGKLFVKSLNKKFEEQAETLMVETLPKKALKLFFKERKSEEKAKQKATEPQKHGFVLNFHGDMRATAVDALREEVNAILSLTNPVDEVIVRLESAGGVVHSYGLAAAQLMRLRARGIPLTITVDKVAASGGYMMACVGNKILAAPFAIVGSIGVIVQLPNFHRLLKEKQVDFEQLMSGEFKRTISLFGENTEEGREKLQHEIEDIHQLFKNLIVHYRQNVDIRKVATGEHWVGEQALSLKLIDEIKTSDDYLLERSKHIELYEITYETKKPFISRILGGAKQSLLLTK